ncbi:MAG: flippase [Thermoplasmata archaeon]|nr:flippase [Thermoplasmata archaeon]
MGSISRLLKNTSVLVASNLATKGLSALFIIYLARYLQDFGFGQYNFALAFASVFIIFSDMGLDALTIKNVARKPETAGEYLESVGLVRLVLSIIMVAIALLAGYLMGLENYLLMVILVAGLTYLFDKMSGLFYALFRARERMELEAGTQITWKLVQIGLGFGAIYFGFSLMGIMLVLLVSSVIKTIVGFTALTSLGIRPERGQLRSRKLLRDTAPFAAYEIGNTLYFNLAVIMLFFLTAPEDTGWFSAAFRIIMFVMLIPSAFDAAIYPLFSKLHDKSKSDMKFAFGKSIKFSLVVAMPVAVMLAILSSEFAGLFGSDFENTSQALFVLSAFIPIFTMNMLMKTALWSGEYQHGVARNIWISALVLGIAAYLLVMQEGFIGAAIALLIGEATFFILNYGCIRRKKFPMGRYLWKPVAAGLGVAALAFVMHWALADRVSNIYITFVAMLVYSLLMISMGVITKSDRELFKEVLSRGKTR